MNLSFVFFVLLEFSHFSLAALVFGFFPVWLKHQDFVKVEIGLILSTEAFMRLLGFSIAFLLSKQGLLKNTQFIFLFSFFSVVAGWMFSFSFSLLVFLFITIVFFCGLWIITPYMEAYCMTVVEMIDCEYSKLISIGTFFFILASFFGGIFFERNDISFFPYLVGVFALFQFLFLWLFRHFYLLEREKLAKNLEKISD